MEDIGTPLARTLALRRALHGKYGDPPFGTYDTVEQEKGQFRSTLRLSERARADVMRKKDYEGEVHRTKREAETSAARVFWDDPCVQERAKTLEPSKSARDIWEESRKQCKRQSIATVIGFQKHAARCRRLQMWL